MGFQGGHFQYYDVTDSEPSLRFPLVPESWDGTSAKYSQVQVQQRAVLQKQIIATQLSPNPVEIT